jgi:peptidoglycan/LPS O-acetylase OafA/YrhL
MNRIKELDGLRAVAIGVVFLVHFTPAGWVVSDLLYLGWSGVDLFFAISGFLITSLRISLRGQDASFKTFWWRRTLRILPPYYLVLILILVSALLRREQMPYAVLVRYWLFLSSVTPGLIKISGQRLFFHTHPVFSGYHRATKYYIPRALPDTAGSGINVSSGWRNCGFRLSFRLSGSRGMCRSSVLCRRKGLL